MHEKGVAKLTRTTTTLDGAVRIEDSQTGERIDTFQRCNRATHKSKGKEGMHKCIGICIYMLTKVMDKQQ